MGHSLIEQLIATQSEKLFCAALGLGFSETDAEELVQATFAAFLSAQDRFEGRSKLTTYLFGIFYNKVSDFRRLHQREDSSEDIDVIFDQHFDGQGHWITMPKGPEESALQKELQEWLERCSERLTMSQRMAFYLKEVEGETTEAICKILNLSTTNLGVVLFRARNKLRECLAAKWGKET